MAQNAENGEDGISTELMEVMPGDSYRQLELARKITFMAVESLVPRLEMESAQLKKKMEERSGAIFEMKERLLESDQAFRETDGRLRLALEENIRICKERDSLAQTTQKLSRDVQKLETFRRQLIHTLHDDNPPENVINIANEVTRAGMQKCTTPPPKSTSRGISISSFGSPRIVQSGASLPTSNKSRPDQIRMAMTPWHRSSTNQSSAATSPPHSRPITKRAQVDGKEFFCQARTRLSYEQFGAFLASIKDLNARKQSREETLKRAQEIFGFDNMDLYLSFHNLVNRSIS